MIKRLILLNVALLAIATWLVYHLDMDLKKQAGRGDIKKIKEEAIRTKKASPKPPVSTEKPDDSATPSTMPSPTPSPSWETDFRVVAEKNLFSKDRSLFKPPVVQTEIIPELNPKPILVGIVTIDKKRVAFVETGAGSTMPGQYSPTTAITPASARMPRPPNLNPPVITHSPTSARRGGGDVRRLEVGADFKDGYKVSEITDFSVTFTYGENKRAETFNLYKDRPARPPGPVAPAIVSSGLSPVITIGGTDAKGGARPGVPTMPVAQPGGGRPMIPGSGAPPATTPAISSISGSSPSGMPSIVPGVSSVSGGQVPATTAPPYITAPAAGRTTGTTLAAPTTGTIKTPFGEKPVQK